MVTGPLAVWAVLLLTGVSHAEVPVSDEPAQLIKGGQPKYPAKPFRNGIQGTVVLEFTVDEKGEPKDFRIVESIPELDQAQPLWIFLWV